MALMGNVSRHEVPTTTVPGRGRSKDYRAAMEARLSRVELGFQDGEVQLEELGTHLDGFKDKLDELRGEMQGTLNEDLAAVTAVAEQLMEFKKDYSSKPRRGDQENGRGEQNPSPKERPSKPRWREEGKERKADRDRFKGRNFNYFNCDGNHRARECPEKESLNALIAKVDKIDESLDPSQQHWRKNVADLKAQIVKKLGLERSNRYFYYLNKLLSQKLSKGEFDKLCHWTLGRENLPLHNQFICSILKNACHAKVPPPIHEKEVAKSVRAAGNISVKEGEYQQSGPSPSPIWSNGEVLPMPPRKGRSVIHNRRLRDRPSPLGPNGNTDFASHQSTSTDNSSIKVIMENGDLTPCDFQRPVHNQQGFAEQPENEQEVFLQHPTRIPRIKRSLDGPVSVHSKDQIEGVVEDGEEVERRKNTNSNKSPLCAPLGLPFCSASVGGARRALPVASSSKFSSSFTCDGLSDSGSLRNRMEHIAREQGLEGVSTDCANLLNNGLDVYLKRLIRSCSELVGGRSGHDPMKHPAYNQKPHGKLINGVLPGHHYQIQSSSGPFESMREQKTYCPISLQDFKVAMELNPQQLGEDWPLLLEKICMHSFEE
ncbi:hypothetical protein HHK36_026087 [Tetracentron sinense]|uniref:Uncharacterized protein n=1 Tax=Tetracentron sinense TaxID=13715 RepID=A0A834YNT3_TETSI|nr:hypothetical protein HHK36_026087 [Tetracentron sinense]